MVKVGFRTFQVGTLRRVRKKVGFAQVVQLGVGLASHYQAAALIGELVYRLRLSFIDDADIGQSEHLSIEAAHGARCHDPELNMVLKQKQQHAPIGGDKFLAVEV